MDKYGNNTWSNNIDDYSFHLKKFKAKKGDIVAAEAKQPTGDGRVIDVIVWGRL